MKEDNKYICKGTNSSWKVYKYVGGKMVYFGGYPSLETARRVRDMLIDVNWNMEEYQRIRDELRAEGVEL